MSTTPTTSLADLLAGRRAEIEQNGAEPIEVTEHGEIVPVSEVSPPAPRAPGAPLAQYPDIPPKVVGGLPYVRDYLKLAHTIHSTEMVPVDFKGRPDAILACFLRGYEMGFGPMQSLDSFNVIQGKVGVKPEAMRALIFDAGHEIILSDNLDDVGNVVSVTATCRRKTWPPDRWEHYTYGLEDARQMKLLGKANWQQQPRAMLDARATAGAGRRYFADVLAGMSYTPEEIRDFARDEQEAPPSTTPSPSPVTEPGSPPPASAASPATASGAGPGVAPESSTSSETAPPKATTSEDSSPRKATGTTRKAAVDSDGRLELRKALTAVIGGLEANQQPLVRAFLAQHGYGDVTKLTEEQIQEAINIVAGWPETADAFAGPEAEETQEGQGQLVDEEKF